MKLLKMIVVFVLLFHCVAARAKTDQHLFADIPFGITVDEFIATAKENVDLEFKEKLNLLVLTAGVYCYVAESNDMAIYGVPAVSIEAQMKKDAEDTLRYEAMAIVLLDETIDPQDGASYAHAADAFLKVYDGLLGDHGKETEAFWWASNKNDDPAEYDRIEDVPGWMSADSLDELLSRFEMVVVKAAFDNVSLVCIIDAVSSNPSAEVTLISVGNLA